MIERLWSGESGWWRCLLPLSWLYGAVSHLIRGSWRCGLRRPWRAPVPVVVVGNLTAGGNGKTPVVIWLVQQLQQRGYTPAVVSRGYGGKAPHYPLVLNAETLPAQAGDEPVLIYQKTSAPVAVAPQRRLAIQALLDQVPTIDLIITDDGLQHYALARDIEVVVVDGVRRFGNGWWLPAGPLRERPSRLKQVDAVITNGGVAQAGEIAMALQPGEFVNLLTGERQQRLDGRPVVAMAGIGHPPRFFNTLLQLGINPLKQVSFADHQPYQLAQLQALATPDQQLVMTEKDAVKCRTFAQANWWYLPVEAELDAAAADQLLEKISQRVTAKP